MWIIFKDIGQYENRMKVAKFSFKDEAEEYLKKSAHRQDTKYSCFNSKSLLYLATWAWVEWEDDVPINPPIDF